MAFSSLFHSDNMGDRAFAQWLVRGCPLPPSPAIAPSSPPSAPASPPFPSTPIALPVWLSPTMSGYYSPPTSPSFCPPTPPPSPSYAPPGPDSPIMAMHDSPIVTIVSPPWIDSRNHRQARSLLPTLVEVPFSLPPPLAQEVAIPPIVEEPSTPPSTYRVVPSIYTRGFSLMRRTARKSSHPLKIGHKRVRAFHPYEREEMMDREEDISDID